LSFSWDETARLWQTHPGTSLTVFSGHHALVQGGAFLRGGRRVATIGDDGRLFVWSAGDADAVPLLAHDEPLIMLRALSDTNDLVVADSAGTIWTARPAQPAQAPGTTRQIRSADGSAVTTIGASSDGRLLAVGQESGAITVHRTADWTTALEVVLHGTIARIEFDPHSRDMLVNSEDGFVHLITLGAGRSAPWTAMQVRAHDVRYSPDGELIAITTHEGGTWFYSMPDRLWRYVHDHPTELCSGQFSPDGSTFVSIDQDGTVVARDVRATFSRSSDGVRP
jgi:WD40 repeat protein